MPVYGSATQYAQPLDLANIGLAPGALQNVTTTVQNAALLMASGIADASLQSRYILPLTQWGNELVRAVAVIAAYDILTSRGYSPQSPDDHIRERYLDALAWLKEVGNGNDTPSYVLDSSIGGTGATPPTPADGSVAVSTEGGLQLQTSNVRGWTSRGSTGGGNGFWDGGFNSK